jgi:predicted DNA-binding protein YlxM (UPF0122 family)
MTDFIKQMHLWLEGIKEKLNLIEQKKERKKRKSAMHRTEKKGGLKKSP